MSGGGGTPNLVQRHYKFGTDNGNIDPDTQSFDSENSNRINVKKGTKFFVRVCIANDGTGDSTGNNFELRYALSETADGATQITTSSSVFRIVNDPGENIPDNASCDLSTVLTNTGTFSTQGHYVDASDESTKVRVDVSECVDMMFCIEVRDDASDDEEYWFSIYTDGGQLQAYDYFPKITTSKRFTKTFTSDAYLKGVQTKTFTSDAFICLADTAYVDTADANNASYDSDAPACNAAATDYKCGTASQNITNYEDGADSGINVCFDEVGGTSVVSEGLGAEESHGPAPVFPANGDAKKYFGTTVNIAAIAYITTEVDGSSIEVRFTGLDNTKKYTITMLGMRGQYTNRWTEYELLDYSGFTADHSSGTISGGTPTGKTCRYVAGDNWSNGYVARWKDVGTGGDGDITISCKGVAQGGDAVNKAYLSAFIITEQQVSTYTKTFTSDAYLFKVNTKTFTSDGFLFKVYTKTFTSDAYLVRVYSKTFTSDGYLFKVNTKTFTSDAYLFKVNTKTFTSDARLVFRLTKTFTSDAYLFKVYTKTFTSDGFLFKVNTKTFTSDGYLFKVNTKTFTSDGYLKKVFTKTFTSDAWLVETGVYTKTFTSDAYLFKVNTKTFTSDGYLFKIFTKTFTSDGFLFKVFTKAFTSDAWLQKTQAKTFTSDAYLFKVNTKDFTTDAFLYKVLTKEFTSDAFLFEVFTKTFTSDGFIFKVFSKTFTSDGYLFKVNTKTFTSDGYLKKVYTKTFTSDAYLIVEGASTKYITFTSDAILQRPQNIAYGVTSIGFGTGFTNIGVWQHEVGWPRLEIASVDSQPKAKGHAENNPVAKGDVENNVEAKGTVNLKPEALGTTDYKPKAKSD
jgi:hypothetical protein